MTTPPSDPPPKPPVSRADFIGSVTALVLTVVGAATTALLGLMVVAFTDNCPPATCDIDAGVTAITAGFGVAAALGLIGMALTIVRLVRRRPAWPFAVATFALTAAACAAGIGGYLTAVGG